MRDPELERLLRAAAAAAPDPAQMPFGFDTRVLARARGEQPWLEASALARLVRRVAFAAVIVTVGAGTAAYWQMNENDDVNEPLTNAYAIADNAIDRELFQ